MKYSKLKFPYEIITGSFEYHGSGSGMYGGSGGRWPYKIKIRDEEFIKWNDIDGNELLIEELRSAGLYIKKDLYMNSMRDRSSADIKIIIEKKEVLPVEILWSDFDKHPRYLNIYYKTIVAIEGDEVCESTDHPRLQNYLVQY